MSVKKRLIIGILLLLSGIVAAKELYSKITELTAEYPESDISGYIAWGAGGATDTISRTISVLAEKELNSHIVMQNKTGATGAIATEFVYRQAVDGYSLLFNAENPTLYGIMNISNYSYDQFYPVLIFGSQTAVIVVPKNSSYESITDLISDAKSRPNEIKIGITGAGGLPFNVAAMFNSTSDIKFNQIPFNGDADISAAVMGGHVDVSVANYSSVADIAHSGEVRILTVMANERLSSELDVEAIGEVLPEYRKYFPWGAFFGVYIDNRCSEKVKETLTSAFLIAFNSEEFQAYLKNNYIAPVGIYGDEARDYISRWQSVSAWVLADAGAAEVTPTEFGIPRIEEFEGGK